MRQRHNGFFEHRFVHARQQQRRVRDDTDARHVERTGRPDFARQHVEYLAFDGYDSNGRSARDELVDVERFVHTGQFIHAGFVDPRFGDAQQQPRRDGSSDNRLPMR
jgi:hypothetical protein